MGTSVGILSLKLLKGTNKELFFVFLLHLLLVYTYNILTTLFPQDVKNPVINVNVT